MFSTTDHCELLALMQKDFKNVLQASVQKQWDEVRTAMSAFTYFDALDEVRNFLFETLVDYKLNLEIQNFSSYNQCYTTELVSGFFQNLPD